MTKSPDITRFGLVLSVFLMAAAGCTDESGDASNTPTLSWDAPMNRVDGSKLYPGEIEGYRIYYRRPEAPRFNSFFIKSPTQTSWTPTRLTSGEYSFAVSTVDTTGLESPRSETLRVTIP